MIEKRKESFTAFYKTKEFFPNFETESEFLDKTSF